MIIGLRSADNIYSFLTIVCYDVFFPGVIGLRARHVRLIRRLALHLVGNGDFTGILQHPLAAVELQGNGLVVLPLNSRMRCVGGSFVIQVNVRAEAIDIYGNIRRKVAGLGGANPVPVAHFKGAFQQAVGLVSMGGGNRVVNAVNLYGGAVQAVNGVGGVVVIVGVIGQVTLVRGVQGGIDREVGAIVILKRNRKCARNAGINGNGVRFVFPINRACNCYRLNLVERNVILLWP